MDEENLDDGLLIEENYYTFLNIPKEASIDEINASYRNLSRIYHPDKHASPESKEKAEMLFNRTKKAYEVLSDPHKRAIYDSLGVKGLQTEGWEIVHRQKTPAEIREEYERLAREREERKLQQRTNPKGNFTVNINATDMFSGYDDEFDEGGLFPTFEVSGMSISQSIESPITLRDTVIMSGNLQSSNGNGTGGFVISGRRLINKGWLELDVGAGGGPYVGFKGSRNLTQKVYVNGGATLNFRRNGILPGLVGTLAVQLDKHTVGYLTYNAGSSSMSTVIEHSDEFNSWNTSIVIGVPHCYLTASYTRKFLENELKLKLSGRVGTFGYQAEYGAEKKISKYSSVFASVSIGVPTGVILRIKFIRSSQSYVFPIHLSEEIVPAAIFYATVTPLIAYFILKKTVIEPMNEAQKKIEIDKAKEVNKQRLAEKKKEAEAAVELMKAQCERIINEEAKKSGLLIISALYGKMNTTSEAVFDNEIVLDVTVPLQCLVKDSKLILYNTSKSELPGFYDPCVGEDKFLKIEYSYRDETQTILLSDEEALRLPRTTSSNKSSPIAPPTTNSNHTT